MKKSVLNTALSTAFVVALGFGISACSGEKEGEHDSHEVMAVDRVDEAAELARANAPEAEDMDFPETSATAVADNATAADEAGATESDAMSVEQEMTGDTEEAVATDSAATDMAGTDSTSTAATDEPAAQ